MNSKIQKYVFLSSVSGFLAVALGAFGAHGLKSILSPEYMSIFETGVRYQFYHSLAALFASTLTKDYNSFHYSVILFLVGNILFSGSLYALALSQIRILGIVTPFGGVCYLLGWSVLIFHSYKKWKKNVEI